MAAPPHLGAAAAVFACSPDGVRAATARWLRSQAKNRDEQFLKDLVRACGGGKRFNAVAGAAMWREAEDARLARRMRK